MGIKVMGKLNRFADWLDSLPTCVAAPILGVCAGFVASLLFLCFGLFVWLVGWYPLREVILSALGCWIGTALAYSVIVPLQSVWGR